MEHNRRCACGVVAKSHPRSHIAIACSGHELFNRNPSREGKSVVILQVAPANDGARFIVEYVYEEDYNKLEKEDGFNGKV